MRIHGNYLIVLVVVVVVLGLLMAKKSRTKDDEDESGEGVLNSLPQHLIVAVAVG